jgi:hypothetical protein
MSGAVPPLPQYAFIVWCLVTKHRDNCTIGLVWVGLGWSDGWMDLSGLGYGPVAGSYEHSDAPSGFIKGGKFLG